MPRSRVTLALLALIRPRDRRMAAHPLDPDYEWALVQPLLQSTACLKPLLPQSAMNWR